MWRIICIRSMVVSQSLGMCFDYRPRFLALLLDFDVVVRILSRIDVELNCHCPKIIRKVLMWTMEEETIHGRPEKYFAATNQFLPYESAEIYGLDPLFEVL